MTRTEGTRDEGARPEKTFGRAWVALCLALAIHVADEALTDFLALYNPAVQKLREQHPWLVLPTFTFGVWLALLGSVTAVLLALSPWAYRARRDMKWIAYAFAGVMVLNGAGHLGASLRGGEWLPGAVSSPLVLAAAIYLGARTRRVFRRR
jgi:hypothetical protein